MNPGFKNFLYFVTGVAIGTLVTKKILDDKYNKIIDERVEEETASIKNVFKRDEEYFNKMKQDIAENKREENRESINQYAQKVNSYGYSQISKPETSHYDTYPNNEFEIISPADYFDEAFKDYEHEELTYYADGILATTNGDDVITEQEADMTIGRDIFNNLRDHFGEYIDDPDTVHVRNNETLTMYEILRDSRTYMEVTEE